MDVLDKITMKITSEIKVSKIDAYLTNFKYHDEYNVIRLDLLPYILYKRVKKKEISIWDLVVKTIIKFLLLLVGSL